MKKNLLMLVVVALTVSSLSAQIPLRPLLEEFTNASCGPCASQNPTFKTLLDANKGSLSVIKYQTVFPGVDPMNKSNPTEVDNRWKYYPDMTGVPTVAINGVVPTNDYGTGGAWSGYAGGPYGFTQDVINYALGLDTPIELTATHEVSKKLDSIAIRIVARNMDSQPFAMANGFLRVAISEQNIVFPAAPGTNGEKEFYDVMRKMLPDEKGVKFPAKLAAGDSVVFKFNVALPSYTYNYSQIEVVAFVQNDDTKALVQSTMTEPVALVGYPDAALTTTTVGPKTYCTYELTPKAKITNKDLAVEIKKFRLECLVNGKSIETKDWTGSLLPGASVDIAFAVSKIAPGSSVVDYVLSNVNDTKDYNALNNLVAPVTFKVLSDKAIADGLEESFEGYKFGEQPAGTILDNTKGYNISIVNKGINPALTDEIGGFGESENSYRFPFYVMSTVGSKVTLIFDKRNLSKMKNLRVVFDRAHVRYTDATTALTNDKLEIIASKDCAATWKPFFNKSGAALATAPPLDADPVNGAPRYYPNPGEWVTDTSKIMTGFDGLSDIVIGFRGTSNWGNDLYIDNINIIGDKILGVEENPLEGKITMYPNPATEEITIETAFDHNTTASITVFDVTGRQVAVVANNQEFSAGASKTKWNCNNAPQGVYTIKVRTNEGELVQRVTVIK